MKKPVIIFGAGNLGAVALEIFNSHQIVVYGFLDNDQTLHQSTINDVIVLGDTNDDTFLKLLGKDCQAFVAVEEAKARKKIVEHLVQHKKTMPMNAIHDQAYLANSVHVGHGNLINMGVSIGTNTQLGNHCIVHAQSLIDHHVQVADYVQIGAGATIGAGVQIDKEAFIGSGVTIIPGVKIGAKASIGAGSVVIRDVAEKETVFGNPAQVVNV